MKERKADPARSGDTSRRSMVKLGVGVMGAGITATIAAPAVAYLTFPLRHKTTSGFGDFLPAGKLKQFTSTVPTRVDLHADQIDAWNRLVNVKIGSVWIVPEGSGFAAFSAACPHLGCGVDYDAETDRFVCYCHKSFFKRDGAVESGPSQRGLDRLELRKDEELVQIRFQRFKYGTPEKEPA